ncbi:PstS family phosphate ABC transporter substrate-binding protein [Flavobacterium sp. RHBU_24]|uniref:PstS family phosphate ABC transporter substrate-binding protein n=1 Tax=Flavobacterium sp. RHBU_24 TaxID=3391185 RepID=UPI003984863A
MKYIRIVILLAVISIFSFIACKQASGTQEVTETETSGTVTLQVDNTVQPIAEDVTAVFQSIYTNAKITQINRSETDIVNALLHDSADVAVLTRELTKGEEAHFAKKGIQTRSTLFATDALALVSAKNAADTIVDIEDIYRIMRGDSTVPGTQLVFDNPGSSTLRYIMDKAGVDKIPLKNVYALKNTAEVLTFVSNNPNAVGFIGVNWLVQTPGNMTKLVENIRVLSVNNVKGKGDTAKYYKPSQSNIATGLYPFTRKLYLLNYQGKRALGMGFANYISAPEGQRIILKSGLVPETMPYREIEIR